MKAWLGRLIGADRVAAQMWRDQERDKLLDKEWTEEEWDKLEEAPPLVSKRRMLSQRWHGLLALYHVWALRRHCSHLPSWWIEEELGMKEDA